MDKFIEKLNFFAYDSDAEYFDIDKGEAKKIIETLEKEPTPESIKKDIEYLENYEKSDLIIDLFKNQDSFDKMDIVQYITQQIFDKSENYKILYTLLDDVKEQIKKEYQKETQKDDGFYNVKANKLEKEFAIIDKFYNEFYNNIY